MPRTLERAESQVDSTVLGERQVRSTFGLGLEPERATASG